jgi:hypothetical protein
MYHQSRLPQLIAMDFNSYIGGTYYGKSIMLTDAPARLPFFYCGFSFFSGADVEFRLFVKPYAKFRFEGPRYSAYHFINTLAFDGRGYNAPPYSGSHVFQCHSIESDFDIDTVVWGTQPAVAHLLFTITLTFSDYIDYTYNIRTMTIERNLMEIASLENTIYGFRYSIANPDPSPIDAAYASLYLSNLVLIKYPLD